MKISEMNNDQATEAMIRLTNAFSVILDDEEAEKMISELEGVTWADAIRNNLPKMVTFALSKHKEQLYDIVGALNAMPSAEVGKMNFLETVKSVRDSFDEVLVGFFGSSVKAPKENAAE